MKLRNLLFIGIAAAAMFAGCKEDEVMKPAAVEIQPESLSFTTEAETKEISLLATRNWTATVTGGDGWLTVEPMSGDGSNDAQTVRVSVIKNEEGPKAATVIFSASNLETELKVTQDGVAGAATTIAYFLAQKPSDEVWYTLTGEITEIKDTKYGNFTIKDETGSVYVYGLTEEKTADGRNDQSFKYLNLKVGDKLTLCGTRDEFKGEAQVGGTAYYISHVSAPVEWPETVTPIADILEMADNDVQVRTTGTVYGTYKAGVVIKDEAGNYLVVYDNGADAPFAELGDEIDVVGTTYLYNDLMMEINYKDHKVLSQDNPYTESAEPVRITSETIETFDKTKVSYIQFEGILIQSGNYYNVMIDGVDDVQGSLSYVLDSFNLDESANTKMVFTGYFCGAASGGKYLNMMVVDAEPASDPWLYLPETSFDISDEVQDVTFAVNTNMAWTISSNDPAFMCSPASGSTSDEVTVSCPANDGTAVKTVTLTITAGENTQTVTINQAFPISGDILLEDDFSSITTGNNTSNDGANSSWSGNENFPTVESAYQAGGAVRLGASKKTGSITSKEITAKANSTVTVTFDVKGWTNVEGDIAVTFNGETKTVEYSATMSSDSFDSKFVTFDITSEFTGTLTIATTAKRAYIDNVTVACAEK